MEKKYVMQTYGRNEIALVSGRGSRLYDSEGKEYIDMTSGIGVNCLGYGNEALTEALSDQVQKLMHCSNLFYSEPMACVAKELAESTGMSRVFFANSGAEANEAMIKTARKYSSDHYGNDRYQILTLRQSFHGRTMTTLMATGQDKFHQYFYPLPQGFDYVEAGNFEDFKAHVNDHVCAVIMEMIQGEGGVVPLDKNFVQQVTAFCKEHDILVCVDEVQTGIGRTGSLFCYEQYDIEPDIVSAAKGLGGRCSDRSDSVQCKMRGYAAGRTARIHIRRQSAGLPKRTDRALHCQSAFFSGRGFKKGRISETTASCDRQ